MAAENNDTSGLGENEAIFNQISVGQTIQPFDEIFYRVSPIIWSTTVLIGAFGIIGNILNLIVFVKLGFSETIHVSYAALAISDAGCVVTAVWFGLACYSAVLSSELARRRLHTDVCQLGIFIGGWPHMAFGRTTALLTAWISMERCLCVTFPTRVRLIVTPKVTKILITAIFVIGLFPVVFPYVGLSIETTYDSRRNLTELFLYYNAENELSALNDLGFLLYGAIYPITSWITVSVCTAFLVVQLKRSSRWRKSNTSGNNLPTELGRLRSAERRERRVTKTVVIIASVFIISSLPFSASLVASVVDRNYSVKGHYRSVFMINTGLLTIFGVANSSINFIVYALTGSRFKSTLVGLLPTKWVQHCRKTSAALSKN
ncbi:hypothetical protein EGW08_009412 [Elysia chlorotica]|uniref:G-protein coupled receptors family 1 profile domain-containing protein n=1 Tax=Elysia chlorotica TaxID=188477 RepID=A0A3S1BG24_ELYCH|nr:hypothetical protein EGW08_009412 [Elysia chlorotica]